MLKKLLKYEFRATARTYGGMYLALLAASVLFGGSVWRWNSTNSDAYSALVGLLSLVYTAVIIGTVVVTIMTIVQRFYRNLLGREGYLMHTLPVTETQLVTSKLISSTVWSLCSILAACLSFGILAVMMMADMDLLEQLPRMWSGHLLRSNDDTQDMLIRLNFGKLTMDFISSDEIDLSKKNSFEIVELQPRPVIEVPIEIVDEKGTTGKMTARLNFDLGCANYVSLFGHSQKVANWIKDTQFRMITTYQANGRKSGKGILANSCSVGELYARNIPVNILNWSVNDMDGLIGPSFFGKKDVYLSPSEKLIYY